MAYLLDADVFIQAKNLHYGFDFCPAFWAWVLEQNARGRVFSIEKVGDEIAAGEDELSAWAEERGPTFFLPPDEALLVAYRRVASWVAASGRFEQGAVATFLQVADAYLVAHALAVGWTVVTHERPANSAKKVKVPDVCIGLGVKVMSPFEMLRHERARFVLGSTAKAWAR
jgi:hypothetical protein